MPTSTWVASMRRGTSSAGSSLSRPTPRSELGSSARRKSMACRSRSTWCRSMQPRHSEGTDMQNHARGAAAIAVLLMAVQGSGLAADTDVRASREREMLRRTQEALRQSQAENAELTAQKASAEKQADEQLKAAAAQLESTRKASRSAQATLQTQLQNAASKQTELTSLLADANRQLSAIAAKQQETAGVLKR